MGEAARAGYRLFLGGVLMIGCPASGATPGSTEGSSTSGADATSEGTAGPTTSSATSEASTGTSASGSESSVGTTASGSESSGPVGAGSSSTGGGCHGGSTQIGPREPTPACYSFADQVAEVPEVRVPLVWTGVMGDPTTIVHVQVELVHTTASYEDGCGKDCVGVSGRVRVVVDTDDGLLAESVEAGLTLVQGDRAHLDIVANSFE